MDAFLVPSQDPHFSEYVPTCFERRAFVSGFTGSASTALVTGEKALLWTDGRYFSRRSRSSAPAGPWMRGGQPGVPEPKAARRRDARRFLKIGWRRHAHPLLEARALRQHLEQRDMSLVYVDTNPRDACVGRRETPLPHRTPLRVHPAEHAGAFRRREDLDPSARR